MLFLMAILAVLGRLPIDPWFAWPSFVIAFALGYRGAAVVAIASRAPRTISQGADPVALLMACRARAFWQSRPTGQPVYLDWVGFSSCPTQVHLVA